MGNPKVTVLMSVYNGEKYLRQAVDSILNQTFRDYEFLIIDDGSTDGTAEILADYARKDPRVRVMDNEKNIGLTKSLNKGLKLARGEYVARMDADDISLPERLGKQVDYLDTHSEVGMVGTAICFINAAGRLLYTWLVHTGSDDIRRGLKENNQFGHGSVMLRKSCLDEVGVYREEFKYAQDYDLWLRVSETSEVANIGEPFYRIRLGVGSISLEKKPEQDLYAEMGRELSAQRASRGYDALQVGDYSEMEQILGRLSLRKASQGRKEMARGYYHWAMRFYRGGDFPSSLRLLFHSLLNYPLDVSTVILFHKSVLRMVMPQKAMNGPAGRTARRAAAYLTARARNSGLGVYSRIRHRFYFWRYHGEHRKRIEFEFESDHAKVYQQLAAIPQIGVERMRVEPRLYHAWLRKAGYPPNAYQGNFAEKTLEHYLSVDLLKLNSSDVVVDVASANSPFVDIIERTVGCKIYEQDLVYAPGINGRRIGGNAAQMPLLDGSVDKITLHCSFEHFEGHNDSAFIRECGRLLSPGGQCAIVPLYIAEKRFHLTNPLCADRSGLVFDEGTPVIQDPRFAPVRFSRFYDVDSFGQRVVAHLGSTIQAMIYYLENEKEVDSSCYVKFILLLTKR